MFVIWRLQLTGAVCCSTNIFLFLVIVVVITRAESEEALRGVMATSGITTIRDYGEFLLSLEKTEEIVKELGIKLQGKICM